MNKIMFSLVLGFGLLQASAADSWLTGQDFAKAQKQAKAENKLVLIDFTGSDWWGFCKKLDQEVYHSKEFAEYAKKNLVLVRADFPNRIKLSDEVKKANTELKEKYATPFQGYPTTVIVDGSGKKLGEKVGYPPGSGPKAFIAEIEKIAKK